MNPTWHQVTEWSRPDEPVETAYGTMRYGSWLLCEQRRWKHKGRTLVVRENDRGEMAAFAASRNNFTYVELTND